MLFSKGCLLTYYLQLINLLSLTSFFSFVLVRDGVFREAELIDALNAPGKIDIPGASGTRNLHDNLSDLRAQVAANQKVCYVFGAFHTNEQLTKPL